MTAAIYAGLPKPIQQQIPFVERYFHPDCIKAERIVNYVSQEKGIPVGVIKSNWRKDEVVYARYLIIYLVKRKTEKLSLKEIAGLVGTPDHSKAIHSIQALTDWMCTDKEKRDEVERLMKIEF